MSHTSADLLRATRAAVAIAVAVLGCAASPPAHADRSAREVGVTFENGGVRLAGTLCLPAGGGRHPAVVLFHGSGPQPRDLATARWFAAHGVAALAYDKRGVGASTGKFQTASFAVLAADGLAGVALLKARPDVDPAKIGVWGLSQGGWLGPLAASQSHDVAFVIAVSGPGVSPGEQMIFYYANDLRARGLSARDIAEASDGRRAVWHFLSTGQGYDAAKRALGAAPSRPWFAAARAQADGFFSGAADATLRDSSLRAQAWYREEVNYDPRVALRALHVPALFIFGDADTLVPVEESVRVIRETLTQAGHDAFSIVVIPGADHGMYVTSAQGTSGLAPQYQASMDQWLKTTLGRRR